MSKVVSITKENQAQSSADALIMNTCNKCGGNGYTKSGPNCYQTCLTCLGKGLVTKQSENIN